MPFPEEYFHKNFHILAREAHLIEEIFYSGLTQLRNSSSNNIGKTYVGFFNLSIGLERICKLIIIADHMCKNGSMAPTKHQIRTFGHNIPLLIKKIINISRQYPENRIENIHEDSTIWKLIEFLGEFAGTVRYENIDGICDESIDVDHMVKWKSILDTIIQEEVSNNSIAMAQQRAVTTHAILGESALYMNFGYDDVMLPGNTVFMNYAMEEKAIARAVRHLVRLIEKICLLSWNVGSHAIAQGQIDFPRQAVFPHLNEFFRGILTYGQNLLKKKRWQYP